MPWKVNEKGGEEVRTAFSVQEHGACKPRSVVSSKFRAHRGGVCLAGLAGCMVREYAAWRNETSFAAMRSFFLRLSFLAPSPACGRFRDHGEWLIRL